MESLEELIICSITQEVMEDPVVASDGHTYERSAIEEWLRNHNASPLTRAPISKALIPNLLVKNLIATYKQEKKAQERKRLDEYFSSIKQWNREDTSALATYLLDEDFMYDSDYVAIYNLAELLNYKDKEQSPVSYQALKEIADTNKDAIETIILCAEQLLNFITSYGLNFDLLTKLAIKHKSNVDLDAIFHGNNNYIIYKWDLHKKVGLDINKLLELALEKEGACAALTKYTHSLCELLKPHELIKGVNFDAIAGIAILSPDLAEYVIGGNTKSILTCQWNYGVTLGHFYKLITENAEFKERTALYDFLSRPWIWEQLAKYGVKYQHIAQISSASVTKMYKVLYNMDGLITFLKKDVTINFLSQLANKHFDFFIASISGASIFAQSHVFLHYLKNEECSFVTLNKNFYVIVKNLNYYIENYESVGRFRRMYSVSEHALVVKCALNDTLHLETLITHPEYVQSQEWLKDLVSMSNIPAASTGLLMPLYYG